MKTRLAHSLLPIALAVIVVACGSATSTAGASPSAPGETPVVTPADTATAAPIAAPTPSAAPSSTADPALADWPVYHLNNQRTGNSAAFPAMSGSLSKAWYVNLDGAVYAEPLVVSGHVVVATEGDSVYSLDPETGATLWRMNLGAPVRLSTLPCGNINPLGITSTPAYDSNSQTLFAVAEVTGPKHILFALDPSTGAVRWSRNVDLSGDSPQTHQQRAALAIANGYVYIGFGGLAGDCGQYVGEVVGVPATGQGATIAYRVPVKREGAVWATGGPVIDSAGNLYVSTGNGSSTTKYDGSDSVVELSPTLKLLSRFSPSNWAADNAADLDLGSLSPVLLPGGLVFSAGKRGTGYVLRQGNLGGIGKQVSSASVCAAFGGAAQSGSTIYVPCQSRLRQVTVGADGSIKVGWTNTAAGESPVVGGGVVWSLASGQLFAIDPATGKTKASIAVGSLPHFASPTLWNGMVFVGTMSGVFAVKA
jgi:outer membrane protein assembly factor BamB